MPSGPEKTRLLVVRTGDTLAAVREAYGEFDAMFLRPLGELGVQAEVVRAHLGEALPPPARFDAVLLTGSPSSVTDRAPWAEALAGWLREVLDADRSLLGVCYGHQLLAHAAGGRVATNPAGYEVGTVDVRLLAAAAADPLLGAVARGAPTVRFHSTHQDAVVELPRGAVRLAETPMTAVQAFRLGTRAWGVQFHPELTEEIMHLYVAGRAELIAREARARGEDPAGALARVQAGIAPTPHGPLLLRRFIELGRDLRSEQVTHA